MGDKLSVEWWPRLSTECLSGLPRDFKEMVFHLRLTDVFRVHELCLRHEQAFADRNPIESWETKLFKICRARSRFPRAEEYELALQVLLIPDDNLVR